MNLFAQYQAVVIAELEKMQTEGALPAGLSLARVAVEAPRDASHGDMATNAAMVLGKPAGLNPKELAATLCARLEQHPDIAAAEVAGPGFINLRLVPEVWPKVLGSILEEGETYGQSAMGAGIRVNCEYVSANPTGPMHVGHARGAVFGDALANLLETSGYGVTREYYINDAGGQIDVLARSVLLRYREALGEDVGAIPEGLYPGDYLKPVGKALAQEFGETLLAMDEAAALPLVRARAVAMMMDLIRDDLACLNVRHEVFFSEKSLHDGGEISKAVAILREKGDIYQGRLEPPKGEVPDDWEDREQTLFRATDFGDDVDRALVKSNGDYTYFAADVAYSANKIARGFNELVYVLGADHGGYVKRLEAVAKALSPPEHPVAVIVRLCQLVKLSRDGVPVRMSKRSGDFVTLREVVDEVGPDAMRFIMLYRKSEAPLEFDFARVTEKTRDNPVYYVQYAYARLSSVLRNGEAARIYTGEPDFSLLTDVDELKTIRKLAEFPRLIESAAEAHEPHRVAFYLYELAGEVHALWNKGKDSPQLRFIELDNVKLTVARLAFCRAVRYVLANGLRILGVRPVEEM